VDEGRRKTPVKMLVRRLVLGLLSLSVLLLGTGALYQSLASRRDLRMHPAPGRMVDIGGYRLHLNCAGSGSPTVVFDSGLSDDSITWYQVQPEIAKQTRACSYDRAGLGWSDPSPRPRTSDVAAEELHTLLRNANIQGPYILVGHSLGGMNMRMFASLYPSESAGMVFVDAASPDQYKRLPSWVQPYNAEILRKLGYFYDTMPFGWPRISGWCDHWPADTRDARKTTECRLRPWLTHMAEYRAFDESSAQVLGAKPIGNIPLAVLSRAPGKDSGPADVAWSQLQEELASLSSRSSHIVVAGSTHMIQEDHPEAVVKAIGDQIKELR
jgi:pimeloyl-ACP methyl ester carboxylesterase